MGRFPAEVLSNIFLEAISELYWYLDKPGYTEAEVLDSGWCISRLLHITRVCREWREIAISSRVLWSYLLIDRYSLCYPNIKVLFDMWLERSNGAPLSYKIDLSSRGPDLYERIEEAEYVSNALLSQQHRWKDVELLWPTSYWAGAENPEGEFNMTNMPLLTSLYVGSVHPLHATIDVGQSSKLRKIELIGNFELLAGKDALRHLTTTTQFIFRKGSAETCVCSCLNFLEAATFLEEFHVSFDDYILSVLRSQIPETRTLTLPRLRLLRIQSEAGKSRSFLDRLILPSLEALDIETRWPDEPIVDLLERSSPPLTFLRLWNTTRRKIPEWTVIDMLRLVPTLKDFRFYSAAVSMHFFRDLTIAASTTGDKKPLCPSLETLCFRDLKFLGDVLACGQALYTMLESRAQVMESFGKVGLDIRDEKKVDISFLKEISASDWERVSRGNKFLFVTPSRRFPLSPFDIPEGIQLVLG